MRVVINKKQRSVLFEYVRQSGLSWKEIAKSQNISVRSLCDWRNGKTLLPSSAFEHFISLGKLDKQMFKVKIVSDGWHLKEASKKGAFARMRLHGNFGTLEGRRKGGLSSIATHCSKDSDFKTRKPIRHQNLSKDLAELLGIFIGDGHLSPYQASVATNSKTDKEHAVYVKNKIQKLFEIPVKLQFKKQENTVVVVASSIELVLFLNKKGMPVGNKLQKGLRVPLWILRDKTYQKAFLRGLFDTDGCIYLDKHNIKGKLYTHLGWTITSYADMLIKDVLDMLKGLGFSPTSATSQKSVYLRKQHDVYSFFRDIGTNNPKHFKRFQKFIGRVPKRS